MGLFTKIVISAGIGLANKIISNKEEKNREELEIKRESEQLKRENERLKIKEQARLEEMKQDYEMEKLENLMSSNKNSSNKLYCGSCGKSIDLNSKFCGYCGQVVKRKEFCVTCGQEILDGAMFCGYCGTKKKV